MNYEPFSGYWFYGATSDAERFSYYSSWGLFAVTPVVIPGGTVVGIPYMPYMPLISTIRR